MIIVHAGDVTRVPDDSELTNIENVDILFVPVGGHGVLSAAQAVELTTRLEPRVVIPIFYNVGGNSQFYGAVMYRFRAEDFAELHPGGRLGRRLPKSMAEALARLKETKADDKAPDHPLTVILRLRQEIELIKVPILTELTEDEIAQGRHVANFVNFRQTLDELCARLKTQCRIDGSQIGTQGQLQRDRNIESLAKLAREIARPPFEEYFRALNEAVGDWARGTTSKIFHRRFSTRKSSTGCPRLSEGERKRTPPGRSA